LRRRRTDADVSAADDGVASDVKLDVVVAVKLVFVVVRFHADLESTL
jgi:hypothetical protein